MYQDRNYVCLIMSMYIYVCQIIGYVNGLG